MKHFLFSLTILLTLASVANAHGTLIVDIEGVPEAAVGRLHLFVFNNEVDWDKDAGKDLGAFPARVSGEKRLSFQLTADNYALSAYHDENDNGSLDSNAVGLPKERFAISNVQRTLWSLPDWDEVKFTLKEGETKHIKLIFKFQ